MTRVYKPFFAVAALTVLLASAGCAELPPSGESGWSGLFSPSETQETPGAQEPDPGYLTPATPYPTAVASGTASPTLSRVMQAPPTPEPYVTIYNRTTQFNSTHAVEAFSFDLTKPPLIIDFRVEPEMVTRIVHAKSDYTNREYKDYTQTCPSPDTWFKVTIRDRRSGEILAEDGFGKLYSADTHKQVFVGRTADCLIELTGNQAKVHVMMRAGGV